MFRSPYAGKPAIALLERSNRRQLRRCSSWSGTRSLRNYYGLSDHLVLLEYLLKRLKGKRCNDRLLGTPIASPTLCRRWDICDPKRSVVGHGLSLVRGRAGVAP